MRILIGCAACFLLSGALGCVSVPEGLRQKGIVVGEGFLSRSVFVAEGDSDIPSLGYITGIYESERTGNHTSKLAVFGGGSLWILDPDTRTRRFAFRYRDAGNMRRPVLVDLDGDGQHEVFFRGAGFSDVGLIGHDGKLLWKRSGSYATVFTANSLSAGDLDKDGRIEFYCAAADGLYRFNSDGSEVWKVGAPGDL